MSRKVDITDKLNFEENPVLVIKEKELEINADAHTMLKVMGLMAGNEVGSNEILEAYDLMFPDKSKRELEKLKLKFEDFVTVVQEAVQLVAGTDERGEQ